MTTKTKNDISEYGKIPPQAVEAEEAVLGALMLEKDSFLQVSTKLFPESFYKDEHRQIFETIKEIFASGMPVDLLIVTQKLKDKGILDQVGGPLYITKLTSRVASAAHIEHHARIIAQKSYQRQMIARATEMIGLAYDDMEDVENLGILWRKHGEKMEDVFNTSNSGYHIKDVLKSALAEIEESCTRVKNGNAPGIPTGIPSLDIYTGGWRCGEFTVMAARPSVGKSSFALILFALKAAKAGYWVNFYSLEMRKEALVKNLIASESGVYRSNIRDGYLSEADFKKVNMAAGAIECLPIIFIDASGLNIENICHDIRKKRRDKKCDFVIIDYIQLIKSMKDKAIREQEIAEISRMLKVTANEESIPVLGLSQLNRIEPSEKPTLLNLRESGAIEQDADTVLFLWRPNDDSNSIALNIAKQRNGRVGDITVYHDGHYNRFSESPLPSPVPVSSNPDRNYEPLNKVPY